MTSTEKSPVFDHASYVRVDLHFKRQRKNAATGQAPDMAGIITACPPQLSQEERMPVAMPRSGIVWLSMDWRT
jgi:hypothetical protein